MYLYYEGDVPNEYVLKLEFDEGQEMYEYKVPVLKLPEISAEELCNRKMVILIPFHILKLRRALEKGSFKDVDELQRHIMNDIIGHINDNMQMGNITMEDALKLKCYLHKLCEYLCAHYEELEVIKDMTDESFMTDIDIMCKEYEDAIEEKIAYIVECEKTMEEQNKSIAEYEKTMEEQNKSIAEYEKTMTEQNKEIIEQKETIEQLLEQIKILKEKQSALEE